MKILTIRLENLNSLQGEHFVDLENDFGKAALFAITGDTGAGKTTLLDAITIALYGRTPRQKRVDDVMSYGTSSASASVAFEVNNKKYLAEWQVNRARNKADGKIQAAKRRLLEYQPATNKYISLSQKITTTDQLVESITGLNFERFCRSVMLAQGDFAAFLHANPSDKSALLERITGTDIYSKISKRAFEKAKEERQILDNLSLQRGQLNILDADAIADITNQIENLAVEQKRFGKEQKILEKIKQWHENKKKLQAELLHKNDELALVEKRQLSHQSDLNLLKEHHRTIDYHELGVVYDSKLEQQKIMIQKAKEQQKNQEKILEQLTELHIKLEKYNKDFEAKKAEKPSFYNKLERVTALDKDIEYAKHQKTKIAHDIFNIKKKLSDTAKDKNELNNQLETTKQKITELQAWLTKNRHIETLQDDKAEIKHSLSEAEKLQAEIKEIEKKQANLTTQQEEILAEIKSISAKINNIKSKETSYLQDLSKYKITDEKNITDTITKLQATVFQLDKEIMQLGIIANDFGKYKNLKKSIAAQEQTLTNEKTIQEEEGAEFQRLEAVLANAQKDLDYKKSAYGIFLLAEQLEVGKPCPVCGSPKHPKAQTSATASHTLRAKNDFYEAEAIVKSTEKSLSKRRKVLDETRQKVHTAKEILEKDKQQLEALEQSIKDTAIKEKLQEYNTLNKINSKLEQNKNEIKNHKKSISELEKIDEALENLQKSNISLSEKNKTLEHNSNNIHRDFQNEAKNLSEAQKKYAVIEAELEVFARKYNFSAQQTKSIKILAQLDNNLSTYKSTQEQIRNSQGQIDKWHLQLSNKLEVEKSNKENLLQQKNDISDIINSLDSLQAERKSILPPNLSASAARENFEQDLATLGDNLQGLQDKKNELLNEKSAIQKSLTENYTILQETELWFEENNPEMTKILSKLNFSSHKEILQAKLAPEKYKEIQEIEKMLLAKESEVQGAINQIENQLKTLSDDESPKEKEGVVIQKLNILQKNQNENAQKIGAFNQKIENNNALIQQSETLLASIQAQEENYRHWDNLNTLIGSADGKKFRVFAQGLTLNKLISLANRHLQNLEGRYQITKTDNQSLEMKIIDAYQANHIRPMSTLSGGETFLISLALALGLSDLSSGNASIKSLFIDEGFGTLSENELDTAITTLENLNAEGKVIGIISHVRELKERIHSQIQVIKKGNGISHLKTVL